jgi:hypothetical protein
VTAADTVLMGVVFVHLVFECHGFEATIHRSRPRGAFPRLPCSA